MATKKRTSRRSRPDRGVTRARHHYQVARERLRSAHEAVIDARQSPLDLLSKPTRKEVLAQRRYDAATKELDKRIAILRKATYGTEP